MTTWFSGERSNSKRSNHAAMVPDRVGKEEAARRIGARPVSTKQHQKTYPVPGTDRASDQYTSPGPDDYVQGLREED